MTIADVELAINTMESQKHFQNQLPYLFIQLPWLIGAGAGGGLKLTVFEAGCLLTFPTYRVGAAYWRWVLI